jgi:hypothetical protein
MTERRRPDVKTDTTRPDDPLETDLDPGAFVGNRPERQAETIPGGIRRDDERIAANSSQATGAGDVAEPSGHREGPAVERREAGQDRESVRFPGVAGSPSSHAATIARLA